MPGGFLEYPCVTPGCTGMHSWTSESKLCTLCRMAAYRRKMKQASTVARDGRGDIARRLGQAVCAAARCSERLGAGWPARFCQAHLPDGALALMPKPTPRPPPGPSIEERVLAALAKGIAPRHAIYREVGCSASALGDAINRLLREGRVLRSRTGLYCLPVNKDVAQCQFADCGKPLEKYRNLDYCREHAGAAFPCVLASEGCSGRVAAWSRSRLCQRHAGGLRNKLSGAQQ